MHAHDCPCCKDVSEVTSSWKDTESQPDEVCPLSLLPPQYWDLVGPAVLGEETTFSSHQPNPRSPFQRRNGLAKKCITDGNAVICIGSDDEDEHHVTQSRRRSEFLVEGTTSHNRQSFEDRQKQRERDMAILEEEREQNRLAQERRQGAGRHRAWGRPAATPEGFW